MPLLNFTLEPVTILELERLRIKVKPPSGSTKLLTKDSPPLNIFWVFFMLLVLVSSRVPMKL